MRNFEELQIWDISRKLVKELYSLCNELPRYEEFNIKSQIRRTAVSMNINISEGCSKDSDKDLLRFLGYSLGSAFEIESLIILCYDLEYINSERLNSYREKLNVFKRKNIAFSRALKRKLK